MYNEKGNFYDRIYDKLNPWARGYLDAIISAQQNVYGMNFLEDMLSGTPETNKILAELMRVEPYTPNHDGIETPAYAYANYFLARKSHRTNVKPSLLLYQSILKQSCIHITRHQICRMLSIRDL